MFIRALLLVQTLERGQETQLTAEVKSIFEIKNLSTDSRSQVAIFIMNELRASSSDLTSKVFIDIIYFYCPVKGNLGKLLGLRVDKRTFANCIKRQFLLRHSSCQCINNFTRQRTGLCFFEAKLK